MINCCRVENSYKLQATDYRPREQMSDQETNYFLGTVDWSQENASIKPSPEIKVEK